MTLSIFYFIHDSLVTTSTQEINCSFFTLFTCLAIILCTNHDCADEFLTGYNYASNVDEGCVTIHVSLIISIKL